MEQETAKTVQIIGKRWFQKTYGNTYFSARGLINGKVVVDIEFEHGYGSHYADRIFTEMEQLGYFPDKHPNTPRWEYCRDRNIELFETVSDVSRKKDL